MVQYHIIWYNIIYRYMHMPQYCIKRYKLILFIWCIIIRKGIKYTLYQQSHSSYMLSEVGSGFLNNFYNADQGCIFFINRKFFNLLNQPRIFIRSSPNVSNLKSLEAQKLVRTTFLLTFKPALYNFQNLHLPQHLSNQYKVPYLKLSR